MQGILSALNPHPSYWRLLVILCCGPLIRRKQEAGTSAITNFFNYPIGNIGMKYFGSTLVKTAPIQIMCALSICFCYKVGLFNIGVAGQYVVGAGVSLYAALAWGLPWYICIILAGFGGSIKRIVDWCFEGIPECQRSYLRHYAELDLLILCQYAVIRCQRALSPYTLPLTGHGNAGLIVAWLKYFIQE